MKTKKTKKLISITAILLLLIAIATAVILTIYSLKRKDEQTDFVKIAETITTASSEKSSPSSQNEVAKNEETSAIFEGIKKLKAENSDLVAFISMPDTGINYPVMQTKSAPEYYIRKGFDKKYSISGTPFIDAKCSPQSDNTIIYGHNMEDGTMFSDLIKLENKEFFDKHKTFDYYTLSPQKQSYQIISIFKMEVYTEHSFEYNAFIDFNNKDNYNEYIQKVKSLSLYDTEISATYGDKLITLSTCSSENDNVRFVVVAVAY